jgi:hypothetical protein
VLHAGRARQAAVVKMRVRLAGDRGDGLVCAADEVAESFLSHLFSPYSNSDQPMFVVCRRFPVVSASAVQSTKPSPARSTISAISSGSRSMPWYGIENEPAAVACWIVGPCSSHTGWPSVHVRPVEALRRFPTGRRVGRVALSRRDLRAARGAGEGEERDAELPGHQVGGAHDGELPGARPAPHAHLRRRADRIKQPPVAGRRAVLDRRGHRLIALRRPVEAEIGARRDRNEKVLVHRVGADDTRLRADLFPGIARVRR